MSLPSPPLSMTLLGLQRVAWRAYFDTTAELISRSLYALIAEARKSPRAFAEEAAETKALIYNYVPVGKEDGGSYQAYFFGGG